MYDVLNRKNMYLEDFQAILTFFSQNRIFLTISIHFCFILVPRLLINIIFFGLMKKVAPKPLLGCQNWVTSMGGRQKIVPGRHSKL